MITTPRNQDVVDDTRTSAYYAPASGRGQLGGDVYALAATPYGTRLLIADVRGKGASAADGARALLTAFTEAAPRAASLAVLAEELETATLRHAAEHHDTTVATENFATAVLGELDVTGRTLYLRNHGHPAPLLLHAGTVSVLEPARRGLPLGLPPDWRNLARTRQAGTSMVHIPDDSTLLLLTDGLTEARDTNRDFYDPVARLTGVWCATPADLLSLLTTDVARHTATHEADAPHAEADTEAEVDTDSDSDDMALLALRCGERPPLGGTSRTALPTHGQWAVGRSFETTGR